jgi:hypothetical protein
MRTKVYSRRKFGSAQIHVEFSTPYMPNARGQARANSGVYLQGRYEIQILDSFDNPTYSNGSAGSLYGQYAPLVHVSRPPKEWQTYDIIFHAPKCGLDRKIETPGTVTVLYNGVLVQDRVTIRGRTTSSDDTDVCEDGPLMPWITTIRTSKRHSCSSAISGFARSLRRPMKKIEEKKNAKSHAQYVAAGCGDGRGLAFCG